MKYLHSIVRSFYSSDASESILSGLMMLCLCQAILRRSGNSGDGSPEIQVRGSSAGLHLASLYCTAEVSNEETLCVLQWWVFGKAL